MGIGGVHANFNPPAVHELLVYLANIEANPLRYHRSEFENPNHEVVIAGNILEEIKKMKGEDS